MPNPPRGEKRAADVIGGSVSPGAIIPPELGYSGCAGVKIRQQTAPFTSNWQSVGDEGRGRSGTPVPACADAR